MAEGLSEGVSGLALGKGLYRLVSGLWGGASGLINGFGGGTEPTKYLLDRWDAPILDRDGELLETRT